MPKPNQVVLQCVICSADFSVQAYRKNTAKTCSRECNSAFISKRLMGHPNYNPYGNKGATKGRKATGRQLEGLRAGWELSKAEGYKNLKNFGVANAKWKGEKVGYDALHGWLYRNYGKPDKCEHCDRTGLTGKKIHWANKTGDYLRERTDWLRLCASCHIIYDRTNNITKDRLILAGRIA